MRKALGLCVIAVAVAAGSGSAGTPKVTTTVGPARLLSRDFGYAVAYRTVERATTAETSIALLVVDHGRWRNVTPPRLRASGIDDVTFVDPRHGWVAAYNCAEAAVYLYRTSDGGRSWQPLGRPTTHSCGGGPTYLSFVDASHGWMEPVSPNGPVGELLRTTDGGRTWMRVATSASGLPCLAPIEFVSRSAGWMARCVGRVFATHDGGRRWAPVTVRAPAPRISDLPRFAGRAGVVASSLGSGTARAVSFSVSEDGGVTWSVRSQRSIPACSLGPGAPYFISYWPASAADARVWWVVAGRSAQVTIDAGRHWRTVAAHDLPARACAVTRVSAADARVAWAVARTRGRGSALFQTRDGGRTWRRVTFFRG